MSTDRESLEPRCPKKTPEGRQCVHDKGHVGDHFAKDAASYLIWPQTVPSPLVLDKSEVTTVVAAFLALAELAKAGSVANLRPEESALLSKCQLALADLLGEGERTE